MIAQAIHGSILTPGEGKQISMLGVTVRYLTESHETDGAWACVEYTAPPRFAGPPPHWHKDMDEGFYVLEGTPDFRLGDETVQAEPGAYIFAPRGTVHAFSNPSDAPARILVFLSPGGFERYWEELAAIVQHEPVWPPANPAKLAALNSRYDQYPPTIRPASS